MYLFLSGIIHAIVNTRSEEGIFREICRAAVEMGGFDFAWVGLLVDGGMKPACSYGRNSRFLEDITSGGLAGVPDAIKKGRIIVNSDTRRNVDIKPWREQMLEHGYMSSATIPIEREGRIVAAISLYSTEQAFFTEDMVPLLEQLGRDISLALEHVKLLSEEQRIRELARFPAENPYPIFNVSKNGEILYVNKGAFHYVKGKEGVEKLLPPNYKWLVRDACASGRRINVEHRFGESYIEYLILPVSENTAHIYGMDITDKKKVQKELEESERALLNLLEDELEAGEKLKKAYEELKTLDSMKGDIIANVSHELRTPMTIAKGFAELAMDEQNDEERKKELTKILEALDKQNAIIGDLIAMAEASREKLKLRSSSFSIKDLISRAIEKKKREMSKKDIELELQVEDFNIKADFDKLTHALINLIDNAIKFNRPQGKISIKARKGKKSAIISVSDTGIGISKDAQSKIFDPLFQMDASTRRKYGGTGMGLAVVRTIVEAHGGEVYVESTPGEGSTFTLVLPLRRSEVKENEKSSGS